MLKNRFLLILLVLLLGLTVIGVANAATIMDFVADHAPVQIKQARQYQNAATVLPQSRPAVTRNAVQEMIQMCWQMDQSVIDRWVEATGLSREDLQGMEQVWMQGLMQQNPSLDLQTAFNMHQAWVQNYILVKLLYNS